jgi:hypothetical protein
MTSNQKVVNELPECRILFIDDNSPFVLPLLRSFSGYRQVHMDVLLISNKKTGTFKHSRYIGRIRRMDSLDGQNIETIVSDTVRLFKSDLVIPTREWISSLLFCHKNELEKFVLIHPLPDDATLEITGNKWNLNHWLREKGYPSAKVSRPGEGWQDSFPVLLKPVRGIGGEGIHVLTNIAELEAVLKNSGQSVQDRFLMEYIEGYDIDLSLFAIQGEIQYQTIQKAVIAGKMVYSKGIQFVHNKTLLEQVSKMIKELSFTGIAHLDFRYDSRKKQYVLVDFNARYWSSVQGSRAMGINFPYLAALWSLSQKIVVQEYRTGYYYFSTTAIRTIVRNFFLRTKHPVRLKDTQLHFLYRDPLPELAYIFKFLFGLIQRNTSYRAIQKRLKFKKQRAIHWGQPGKDAHA